LGKWGTGHCAGVGPLRNGKSDCTRNKSRKCGGTGHYR
jgi:hypothetical protein